jgi:hypothetical protein
MRRIMRKSIPILLLLIILQGLASGSYEGKVIERARAFPSPFSPNGDGKNDSLFLSISLRPSTVLPIYSEGDRIKLSVLVMDLRWRVLTSVFDGFLLPGSYEIKIWDGKDREGRAVPRGVYILRVEARSSERRDLLHIPVSLVR